VVFVVGVQDGAGIGEIPSAEVDKQRILSVGKAGDLEKDVMWDHGRRGRGRLGSERGVEAREVRTAFGDDGEDLSTCGPGAAPRVEATLFGRA